MFEDDPARVAILTQLQRCAVAMYGEQRAADALLQRNLADTAFALWRVSREPLGPDGDEP